MYTKKIALHYNVDLDAVACYVASGVKLWEVEFFPASVEPKDIPEGVRALDIGTEEATKGRLEGGKRHAAVLGMPEAKDWPVEILAEIDEHDSTGRVENPQFSLSEILMALRGEYYSRGARGETLDMRVLDRMGDVLRGLVRYRKSLSDPALLEIASRCEPMEIGGGTFAIMPEGNHPPGLGVLLSRYGYCGGLFHHGFNLGVVRYPGFTSPDLTRLEFDLPGWFIHPAGFLACWGSRKARATEPPPSGTPQTVGELASLLRRLL